jgi:RNA polymerase sigma-70 factor (ECF subfamily)
LPKLQVHVKSDPRAGALLYIVRDGPAEGPSDEALAHALKEGRPEAFALAWTRFSPLVFGAIARALGRDEEAQDLTQEVFLRLHRRVHTLEDPTALRAFVYSIAVRVIKAELRRRWVRRIMKVVDTARLPEPEVAPASPEDQARDAIDRLYRILDRLNARDRTIYVLRHIEGLSLEDTAAAVGVSLATVKRRLAHAGERVAHHLRADPVLREYAAPRGPEARAP